MSKIKSAVRILQNRSLLINYLSSNRMLDWMPDTLYLKLLYKYTMNKKLNLKNPITFSEKLQWLKVYNQNPLYTQLVDKYAVREYIKETIGEEYIIPLIGVYENVDDIDFNNLPDKFVLKCTHDSGSVIICNDKNTFNIQSAKQWLKFRLKSNYYFSGREWPYKNVVPRIVCEKLLDSQIYDYKIFCFNGKPNFLYVSQGLVIDHSLKVDFYDLSWNRMPFKRTDYDNFETPVNKPANLEAMIVLAEKLSKGIPFVRVDLYEVDNKIYFSEFTFTPCSGFMPLDPIEYDKILGDLIELPQNGEWI